MLLFKITVKVVYSFCSRYYKIQLCLLAHHELENKIECTVKFISYNSLWVAVNNYKSAWNISFKNIQVSTYPMLSAYLKAIKKKRQLLEQRYILSFYLEIKHHLYLI